MIDLRFMDRVLKIMNRQGVKTALKIIDNNLFKVDGQGVK